MRNLSRLLIKLYLVIVVLGAWTSSYAQIIETKSITCNGANDGQINVVSVWGTPPYTYAWTLNAAPLAITDSIIKAAAPGTYQVTVTDALAVDTVWTYNLSQPALIVNVTSTTSNTTWLVNDGRIIISSTVGGNGTYTYTLLDSIARKTMTQASANYTAVPTPRFINLASGKYTLTTTDKIGCKTTNKITVAETASYPVVAPAAPIHTIDTTACYFDTASSSVKPDTLPASVYPISVFFDNMTVPYKIIRGFRRGANIMHYGAGAGTNQPMLGLVNLGPHFITAWQTLVSGPNAGKDSATEVSSTISSTFAKGFHVMKVVTANGRGYRFSWVVDSITSPISINISSIVHNVCHDGSSGSFTCTAEGSYEGFTYRITGPAPLSTVNVTTASASGLRAGVYTFTATDVNEAGPSLNGYLNAGCVRTERITINEPDDSIRIFFDPAKNARCPYSLDGAVNFRRVDGATFPVSYSWSNGDTTPDLTNIQPGSYALTVTDANGCVGQDSVKIEGERKNCFYNIVTPNGDGYNDKFDLTDFCVGVQMKAVIFNEAGKLIATLDETNPIWDAVDPSLPPTGTSSTYTCFVSLFENGKKTVEFSESFSVVYPK